MDTITIIPPTIDTPLTPAESQILAHHLEIIRTSFVTMVRSIGYIYHHRLYRGNGHRTWQKFCADELNFSARYGWYFIEAFSVLSQIEEHNATTPAPLPIPAKLAQTRALAQTDDLLITTWQIATTQHDNPTARQIASISHDLMMAGVSYPVANILGEIALKNANGAGLVRELVTTGYLQFDEEENAIALGDVRVTDLRRYQDELRKEAMLQRVASEGGVVITVYPSDLERTAKALRGVLGGDAGRLGELLGK